MTKALSRQPRLDALGDYPFTRLRRLFGGLAPSPGLTPIDAGAGEPRRPQPEFVAATLGQYLAGFSHYPPTAGAMFLREAIAGWLVRRYGLPAIDPATQVLAANGTREALFAVAHALVNPDAIEPPYVLMPNPMYQIYLGGAVLAGARPWALPCTADTGFAPDLDAVPERVWERTAFIYVCSPSNPTGWVADAAWYRRLLALAERHDFYIVADECYSEIYRTSPPVGLLEVCAQSGRGDFARCLVMNSLSKRSALPGLRSGFIAGDARLIARFAKLRSYTGPATPLPLQHVAAAAWNDESHVATNLASYRASLDAFFTEWGKDGVPAGTFFAWLDVGDGEAFARAAYTEQAVTVLPGAYLAIEDASGENPGRRYVRAALVDGPEAAAELAKRLGQVRI
ncbi:MAG: aminotransferase class I/II-fold pyridoxal phosphate-dependent enzyme [Zetaproteobacteria bacterium]|nr:MAG: aminotransferase class I/II-fold pyridoxal phosphate-dependent enzyme [Zetaproteobacteria bacterium]